MESWAIDSYIQFEVWGRVLFVCFEILNAIYVVHWINGFSDFIRPDSKELEDKRHDVFFRI
jgi:hypothetical protein